MSESEKQAWRWVVLLAFTVLVEVSLVAYSRYLHFAMMQEAVQHGYAQHNPITGEWEWKEKSK